MAVLEKLYIANVFMYLNSIDDAVNLALVNKKCLDSALCLKMNPDYSSVSAYANQEQYSKNLLRELNLFTNTETLKGCLWGYYLPEDLSDKYPLVYDQYSFSKGKSVRIRSMKDYNEHTKYIDIEFTYDDFDTEFMEPEEITQILHAEMDLLKNINKSVFLKVRLENGDDQTENEIERVEEVNKYIVEFLKHINYFFATVVVHLTYCTDKCIEEIHAVNKAIRITTFNPYNLGYQQLTKSLKRDDIIIISSSGYTPIYVKKLFQEDFKELYEKYLFHTFEIPFSENEYVYGMKDDKDVEDDGFLELEEWDFSFLEYMKNLSLDYLPENKPIKLPLHLKKLQCSTRSALVFKNLEQLKLEQIIITYKNTNPTYTIDTSCLKLCRYSGCTIIDLNGKVVKNYSQSPLANSFFFNS
ncbi:hypothetical protein QTN25_007715 [Entamoeba marina]